MSDAIKHECGIALLRLKKPLEFYLEKYGTAFYGLNKMQLLMEKQHNRGQDGAGLANIKLDMLPGDRYISRVRSIQKNSIQDIFEQINARFIQIQREDPKLLKDIDFLKRNAGFTGELFLGHLRYGTFGRNSIESCHPFLRQNNWISRNLVVAGNFNLTNVDELFEALVKIGQHPKEKSDTVTVLEEIGHFLDLEHDALIQEYKSKGYEKADSYKLIAEQLSISSILQKSSHNWDGGYAMAGLLGHGDAFVLRDPAGIRPTFWFENDEVCVVASERPVIQTAFNLQLEDIHELKPGHALIIKKNGIVSEELIHQPLPIRQCSFERIYFSRGSDADIYKERQALGNLIVNQVMKAINNDLCDSVFSFIPNTAEVSFLGMIKGIEDELNERKVKEITALGANPSAEDITKIIQQRTRIENEIIQQRENERIQEQRRIENDNGAIYGIVEAPAAIVSDQVTLFNPIASSGFTGLWGGIRHGKGYFHGVGDGVYWWSASEDGGTGDHALCHGLSTDNSDLVRDSRSATFGFSVRCVKD